LPKFVRDFLDKVKLDAPYKFLVATYGEIASNFINHTKRKYRNLDFHYFNVIKMVDNALHVQEIKKQIARTPKKHIDEHIAQVKQEIDQRLVKTNGGFKLSAPLANIIRKVVDKQIKKANFIKVDHSRFNKCLICNKVCPCNNIALINNQITVAKNCTSCFACAHHCPQIAIHVKHEKSEARFINEHITLSEIIKANHE
jgi:ferredoxin